MSAASSNLCFALSVSNTTGPVQKYKMSLVSLIILGLFGAAYAESLPTLIESKLDGKVLTVVDEYAPPIGGPYQRYGVRALAFNSSLPQFWVLDENNGNPNEGRFYSANATSHNSFTTGLLCQDCFSYMYYFDVSHITEDGSRLVKRLFFGDDIRCVQNLGGDEFITDAECDENDESQLWYLLEESDYEESHLDDEEEQDEDDDDALDLSAR